MLSEENICAKELSMPASFATRTGKLVIKHRHASHFLCKDKNAQQI
jgi:hypothetical protein